MTQLMLGKLPAKKDERTFTLRSILAPSLPPPPPVFDTDMAQPCPLFIDVLYNDLLGDCVMAGRGHHTLRFEATEQGTLKLITKPTLKSAVKKEYFIETGGADAGLVVLDSLNHWRQNGWTINRRKYSIYAFAAVHPTDHVEVMQAISLLQGVGTGFQLPQSAEDAFYAGKIWDVVHGSRIVGGHYIYFKGYNPIGPVIISWGKVCQMTWAFLDYYCDEMFAVVDNVDKFLKGPPRINVPVLNGYLQGVSNN